MVNELTRNPVKNLKIYISNESVKARFEEMLGKRGSAFTNSIVNVVRNSFALQKCTPESIMSAAVIAATLNLPIDPALGQAAIVPYKTTANFQIMYKGMIQLCIRSGMYQTIHCSEIYADELKSHNPITGVVKFNDPATYKMRYESKGDENVVGHYAYFKLTSGFEKSDYMTKEEVMAHARKYSKAYQKDIRDKKKDSSWSIYPIPMGNKTVIIRLLDKYGLKSIIMQEAIIKDNSFEAAEETTRKKIDAEQGSEPIDTNFEATEPEEQLSRQQKAARTRKANAQKKALEKADTKGKADPTKFLYTCKNCGCGFDEPKKAGTGANTIPICRHCLSKNIVSTEDEKPKPEFMAEEDAA